jgi:K+-sensing histidine kinase KdpD
MLRADAPPNSEAAGHADGALGDAMRLNRLANNLLDIHRLDAGRMPVKRETADIAKLARGVVLAMRVMDPARHLEVRGPASVICHCDTELLRRVIENLVSNAMKHSPSRARIWIDVVHTSECVRIAVQDEGPGIPPALRGRVFERYSARSIAAANGRHSVGLGLAFCQLAVTAHGGSIHVEGAEPHGSVFVVELPHQRGEHAGR